MSCRVMLIIEVMCIPHALIVMLVRTHMDIYIGVCWILLHAAVQSGHGRDWWIRGSYTDGRGPASWFIVWPSVQTQDWVKTSVLFDNDICPTILASGVSLSIIMPVPSHAEFFHKEIDCN